MNSIKRYDNTLIYIVLIMLSMLIIGIFFNINTILFVQVGILTLIFFVYIWKYEEKLLYYCILLSTVSQFLGGFFKPASYLAQVFLILLALKLIEKIFIKKIPIKVNKLIITISFLMLFLDSSLYLVSTRGNIILYVWAILKKYGFLIIYLYIINLNNTEKILINIDKTLKLIFIIQFIFTFIQFKNNVFFDDITGLFGSRSTGEYSTFLIIYLLILINRNDKNDKYFIVFLSLHILIYAIIAEVKLLMILFPSIIILNTLVKRKKVKDYVYFLSILLLLLLGYRIYTNLYPEQADSFNSMDQYLTEGYGVNTDLNRLNVLGPLEQNGVLNDNMDKLFGRGLGSVHPSEINLIQGPLYKQYEYLRIEWFTLPYLITESGILGAMLYISIYVIVLINSILNLSKNNCKTLLCISIVAIIIIIYNSSLITSLRVPIFIWMWIGFLSKEKYNLKI